MKIVQNLDVYREYLDKLATESTDLMALLFADQLREGLPFAHLYRTLTFGDLCSEMMMRTSRIHREIDFLVQEKAKKIEEEKKKSKQAVENLVALMRDTNCDWG